MIESLFISNIIEETISDGVGLRMSIYLSGCNHKCHNCHNTSTWNPNNGTSINDEIISEIVSTYLNNPLLDGITFSGGDPFYNCEALLELIVTLKASLPDLNIWCYSGYTFEEILSDDKRKLVLPLINVLVDGRYKDHLPTNKRFIGSSNQRIINVKESLLKNQIILFL